MRTCRCSEHEIRRYLERISGPLLDRIDLQVETDAVPVDEINQAGESESSASVRARVQAARKMQQARFAGTPSPATLRPPAARCMSCFR